MNDPIVPVHFQINRALCGVCTGFTEPARPDLPEALGGPHDCACQRPRHLHIGTARKALALALTVTAVVSGLEPLGFDQELAPPRPDHNYTGWVCMHCRTPRFFKTASARKDHVRNHHPGRS